MKPRKPSSPSVDEGREKSRLSVEGFIRFTPEKVVPEAEAEAEASCAVAIWSSATCGNFLGNEELTAEEILENQHGIVTGEIFTKIR